MTDLLNIIFWTILVYDYFVIGSSSYGYIFYMGIISLVFLWLPGMKYRWYVIFWFWV